RIKSRNNSLTDVGEQKALQRVLECRVFCTYLVKTRSACLIVQLDQLIKKRTSLLPQRAVEHHASSSSAASHARAERRSRFTVASDRFIVVPISSRVRPPKYRCSTIRACRSSSCSSRVSASSSAVTLSLSTLAIHVSSFKSPRAAPPPRLTAVRLRA